MFRKNVAHTKWTHKRQFGLFLKRVLDIIGSIIGLLVFSPLIVIIAILIKCSSRDPVFYRGVRAGRHGKPFRIYKFRTMILNAEKPGGDTTALYDPRITRIGSFLREYKIDEIPQFFNILKGDMSLVGPRPELFVYTKLYNKDESCILDVRPGITDFSSIEFHSLDRCVGSKDVDSVFEEFILPQKNSLRIKYVRERSLWLDVKIILQTIRIILSKIFKGIVSNYRSNYGRTDNHRE